MTSIAWPLTASKRLIEFFISHADRIRIRPHVKHDGDKVVGLSLTAQNYRFYYPLIRHLSDAGYACYIQIDYKFLHSAKLFLDWISKLDNVYFSVSLVGNKDISFLIKDKSSQTDNNSDIKVVILSDEVYTINGDFKKDNIIPFSMHPDQYALLSEPKIRELRNANKTIRIFFSGNTSGKGYKDEFLNVLHGKMSRNQIINAVFERFGEKIQRQPTIGKSDKPIHLYVSDFWVNDELKNQNVSKSDWFSQLAQCQFFLACPGFSHPMCHNLIESMAVGCIPILEHAEYLSPALVHKKNCISFSGQDSLQSAIEEVLMMTDADISIMQSNVIDYYENYLSGVFVVKMLEQASDNSTLYYYSSAQSIEVYYQLIANRKALNA
ncbi:hypothetical protein I2I05_13410 [Hymenobacter sp. BT683]|uniref:Glycosyltransferase family 4 protein n=1 Tax=Hymenobacter jeongseonensis TaxID=2791027 RepID=A0ABS0IJ43_9BACT|nr:hypothetical protein [Hymenobacter jeongseonensis]MBF9238397.1 hypothetical protein [Hymenobacter jeongseonensis]